MCIVLYSDIWIRIQWVYCKDHWTVACAKFFRLATSSIPNMEKINEKYSIKTKNSKTILSFSTRANNEKFQIQITQNR